MSEKTNGIIKITAADGTVIEGSLEDLAKMTEVFESLGETQGGETTEEAAEESEDTGLSKDGFKVGDRVRINIPEGETPEYNWGEVFNGDVGTVVEVCEHKVVVNFPKQSYWNALPSELEMITIDEYEEATEKDAPFKPGDIVEVVDSPMAQPEGTRFVVKEVEQIGEKAIVTDGRGSIYCAKKHVKLIEKAGESKSENNDGGDKSEREPGEIRLGDVVRVDNDVVSYHNEGDIGIVTEYENNGNFRVETPTLDHANWVGSHDVTLLAKVEDRADDHEYA